MPNYDDGKNVPFQFEVPVEMHRRVTEKARENGLSIAPFMRAAFDQFAERPIEESMALLKKHNERKRRKK